MAVASAEVHGPSDAELIEAVRHGSTEAFGELYERHVSAAYSMASQVSKSPSEADDLVSESFAKVLDSLRDGGGPTTAFRAYLLTTVRRTAYDRTRRNRKIHLAGDVTEVSGADVSVPFTDPAVDGLERSMAARAFKELPERWQAVLWHVEVEGRKPAEVAPLLGLTANGVSALAYRAREGLRQAYLQMHLGELGDDASTERCRATVGRLGAWTRNGLAKRESAQVDTHLDDCGRCRTLAAELAHVNGALRAIIGPLVLGVGAAGYLAATPGSAAAATTTASGAAGAGSAVPRQTVTSTVSAAALAAAMALALTSAPQQPVPQAAAQPPVPPAVPPAPEQPKPAPARPKPPPPAPAPAPAPPPPATPNLAVSGPTESLEITAGGEPVTLPITVTNNGQGDSAPVNLALTFPPGITVTPTQRSGYGTFAAEPAGSGDPATHCEVASPSVRCSTDRGLRPGESATFTLRIQAAEDATGGPITGSIGAGPDVAVALSPITVRVRPQVQRVEVNAQENRYNPVLTSIDFSATNTGQSTSDTTVVATIPDGLRFRAPGCSTEGHVVRCESELAPGETTEHRVWLTTLPVFPPTVYAPDATGATPHTEVYTIPITATLGTADDSTAVSVELLDPPPRSPDKTDPELRPSGAKPGLGKDD